MASGKQLSFAYGEVSDSLRFKSDAQFYPQGLRLLYNGTVKKSGGVQNRPGFLYLIRDNASSADLPVVGDIVKSRLFPFTGSDGKRLFFSLGYILPGTGGNATPYSPTLPTVSMREVDQGDGLVTAVVQAGNSALTWNAVTADEILSLAEASLVQLGDSAIITVPGSTGKIWTFVYKYTPHTSGIFWDFELVSLKLDPPAQIGTPTSGTITLLNYGLDPKDLPVCYMVTQEQTDGSEVEWLAFCFAVGHPHSELSAKLSGAGFDCPAGDGIKQYNVYRSPGTGANSVGAHASHYALVGRIAPVESGGTIFVDYLVTPDFTVQPPTDTYLYAPDGYVRKLTYYKERAVFAYKQSPDTGSTPKYYEGQMGASKLGAPKMFGRPLTPNLIDAFSFTIPQDKLGQITQMLVLNRLVVFTRKHTFLIKGGDNGVLTSQAVNPETVYFEGAPEDVSPALMGGSGFFVNADKSKILMISYASDQTGATVTDVSALSEHLFEKRDVRNIAVTTGKENILWVLRKDGTLLSFTYSPDTGIQGWARHQTNGYIEDICVQEVPDYIYAGDSTTNWVQTLYVSVIRDGYRRYERLAIRDDLEPKRFMYADYAVTFGRIKSKGDRPFNITTTTDFLGGSVLRITDVASGGTMDGSWVGKRIDFFFDVYDTEADPITGEFPKIGESKVRFIAQTLISSNILEGYCEEDIPAVLQNVAGQSLTAAQKLAVQNRWLEAINQITGVTRLAGKDIVVYADGILLGSPWNAQMTKITVANDGTITLPDYYNWGYYGIPYKFAMETLDLEASDARTFTDTGKLINKLGVGLLNTQGGLVGQSGKGDFYSFESVTDREEESVLNTTKPVSGYRSIVYPSSWDKTGRITLMQLDALPMSILAVYPKGVAGDQS